MAARWMLGVMMAGVVGAVVSPGAAAVTAISSPVVNPGNGHTYVLLSNANWSDSETAAVALGGHLATIRNATEQSWVFGTFANYGSTQRLLWIGLNDVASPSTLSFVWTSGEALTYTNWDSGEPNNANGTERYVAMYYPGFRNPGSWNDWGVRTTDPIGVVFNGVAEIVPEPGTVGVLGMGVMVLARRRRGKEEFTARLKG